jgi:nucleotide-binding universal stress UspA family protein
VTSTPGVRDAPPDLTGVARAVRPVMLVTLNVPFDPVAIEFALQTAAETGAELYVCDAIPLEYRNYVGHVARQYSEAHNRRYLNEVAARARDRGIRTTQIAFHNPKPIRAALEVAEHESVGLLVFGPERSSLGRWTFRRAARRLREHAPCLVWINE